MVSHNKKGYSLFSLPVKISLLAAICFTATAFFNGPDEKTKVDPTAYQPNIASLVSRYLERFHYQQYRLNDELSKRIFDAYIDSLDPSKMFFLESDIKGFRVFESQLDDDLRANPSRLDVPYKIYKVYQKRAHQRVEKALELLDSEFDFTKEEQRHFNREKAPWAKTEKQLDNVWRLRIKDEVLTYRLRESPPEDYMDILRKRYKRITKNVSEMDQVDIAEIFLSSLAGIYDPHSSYLKPATKDNFDIQMGHSLEGIGATLTVEGEYTKVTDLVKGGPAEKSGQIHKNDKIIAVAQGEGKSEDVVDMRLDKVVKKIRGPKGSKVRLTIIPSDAKNLGETREVTLIRDRVELKSQDAKAEIMEVKDDDGQSYRLGVINVPSFYLDTRGKYRGDRNYKSTTRDVRKLIDGLEKEKVDGIVMDLRRNGGGSLDEAIQLTGLFIDYGPVVQIKDFTGKVDVEIDPDPSQVYDGPLLVLTSVFSASASEIFASAVQDYGRGVVVGAKSTHGKGTVQNIASLQSRLVREMDRRFEENIAGALKLTTHKFYRISGGSTQHKGVEPDVVLPSPYDGMKVKEEDLDYALPWDEIDPVAHKTYDLVRDSLPLLNANSAKRIAKNPEFQYVQQDSKKLEERREENQVSLNLEERRKEKEKDKLLGEDRDEQRKMRKSVIVSTTDLFPEKEEEKDEEETEEVAEADKDKVEIPDFVLEEALLIMRDYISHRGQLVAGIVPKKDSL